MLYKQIIKESIRLISIPNIKSHDQRELIIYKI